MDQSHLNVIIDIVGLIQLDVYLTNMIHTYHVCNIFLFLCIYPFFPISFPAFSGFI